MRKTLFAVRLFRRKAVPSRREGGVELDVYGDDAGRFPNVRGRRVLIYWPHGLGDFVHLGLVAPLLEPSNEYFITRFGDTYLHLYDGCETIRPILSGRMQLGDGTPDVSAHLGLALERLVEGPQPVDLPPPLQAEVERLGIDTLLAPRYPEKTGQTPYPFHTKARLLASRLVAPDRLAAFDLQAPLRNGLPFDVPSETRRAIEARLTGYATPGDRLYLIAPGGHTQLEKVWSDAETRAFVSELRARDPAARPLIVDERNAREIGAEMNGALTTADLFAGVDLPFAHVVVTLIRAAYAFVGVPAGPFHTAIAVGGLPIVGLWLWHWPQFYDEPSSDAVHLVGPRVYRQGLDRRIGARGVAAAGTLRYDIRAFRERPPGSADVLSALGLA
jgi:hypothetical protein